MTDHDAPTDPGSPAALTPTRIVALVVSVVVVGVAVFAFLDGSLTFDELRSAVEATLDDLPE